MGETTGSLFMIGRRVGSVSITPLAALVAAVVAVGMWATRERRPTPGRRAGGVMSTALSVSGPVIPSRHTAIGVLPAKA